MNDGYSGKDKRDNGGNREQWKRGGGDEAQNRKKFEKIIYFTSQLYAMILTHTIALLLMLADRERDIEVQR